MTGPGRKAVLLSTLLFGVLGLVCAERRLSAQTEPQPRAAEGLAVRANDRLRVLYEEADRLAGEARTILQRLRHLELNRRIASESVRSAQAAIDTADAEREALLVETEELSAAIEEERPRLQARLVNLYKLGHGRYSRLLLSAGDVRQFARAARTVAAMTSRDQQRIQNYQGRRARLQAARAELDVSRETLETRRAEAAAARAGAVRAVAAEASLIRDIDQRRDLNAALVSELQAAQHKLDATLADASATTGAGGLPIAPFRGALPWPTSGVPAARRAAGVSSRRPGVEILSAEAADVTAVHEGTVVYAGSFDGFGNLVIVDHGGATFSLYGHLLEVAVGRGTPVQARQIVGRVGGSPGASASQSGAPTLYFELRVAGKAVDPLPWLRPQSNLP